MRKFSKLNESKDDLIKKLGSTEDYINDSLIDLVDLGYDIGIHSYFLSDNGHTYTDYRGISESYPILGISIYRTSPSESTANDVRNWDGGVYYEDNIEILEAIYHSLTRLQSTFSDKAKFYFSIRNVNEISIRVTFDKKKSEGLIDIEELGELISKTVDEFPFDDEYYLQNGRSFYTIGELGQVKNKKRISIRVRLPLPNSTINIEDLERDDIPVFGLIKKTINDYRRDNKYQLDEIYQQYTQYIFDKLNKSGGLVLAKAGPSRMIQTSDGVPLIEFKKYIESLSQGTIITKKSKLFSKEEKINYELYTLEISIDNKISDHW